MNRIQALQELDKHLLVCTTCSTKLNGTWRSVDYNRLQNYCNKECPVGLKMQGVRDTLDDLVREKRMQKGMSA
jgi:hypothetical protein